MAGSPDFLSAGNTEAVEAINAGLDSMDTLIDSLLALVGSANPPAGGTDTVMKFLKQLDGKTGVKSRQLLVFTPNANPYSVAISSVNPAKCDVRIRGNASAYVTYSETNYSVSPEYIEKSLTATELQVQFSGGTLIAHGLCSAEIVEFY